MLFGSVLFHSPFLFLLVSFLPCGTIRAVEEACIVDWLVLALFIVCLIGCVLQGISVVWALAAGYVIFFCLRLVLPPYCRGTFACLVAGPAHRADYFGRHGAHRYADDGLAGRWYPAYDCGPGRSG